MIPRRARPVRRQRARARPHPEKPLRRPNLLTRPHGAGFIVTAMGTRELVARSGVSRKALRLYEARGILPPPRRTLSGYRIYDPDVLGVLDFIQRCRRLGLTLTEIKQIISLRRAGTAPCVHVRRLLMQKEADLKALLAEIHRILAAWPRTNGGPAAICPHIEGTGGHPIVWKGTLFAPRAHSVRKSSLNATRSASEKRGTVRSSRGRNGTFSST